MEILVIDDNPKELEKYSGIFEANVFAKEHFKLHTYYVGDIKGDYRFKESPDLFLIDFRFDLPGGEDLFNDGYVLATALRNIYFEVPILLFTRKDIFNVQKFPNNIIDIVDDIMYKSDIIENEDRCFQLIHSIAEGYNKLSSIKSRTWESLLNVIDAPKESINDLANINRPIAVEGIWKVIDSANWIRKTILKYPGILLNEMHSSAFLGISTEAFRSIEGVIMAAKYNGVFSIEKYSFYWRSLLRAIAIAIMNKHEINKPIHLGFCEAYKLEYGKDLEPSICISSGEQHAEKVCYVLELPVKTKYSLIYNIDNRPKNMDDARVSWKAIRTTNEVKEELLSPIAQELLVEIKKNK